MKGSFSESFSEMTVGICRLSLILADNNSLKDKRQAMRKIKDTIRNRYNVSIAEVGDQELWQRALLGIALVSNDRQKIESDLRKIINEIEKMHIAQMIEEKIDIFPFH
ncbi:MAG: DUF503 domain-containing protein [Deltaproteobacteria bacterium]|nr:DUF503 domain-containing protein [Deltaproteobacteria bacterium]